MMKLVSRNFPSTDSEPITEEDKSQRPIPGENGITAHFCRVCELGNFTSPAHLKLHHRFLHHLKKPVPKPTRCFVCKEVFWGGIYDLGRHLKSEDHYAQINQTKNMGNLKAIECELCGVRFWSLHHLSEHQASSACKEYQEKENFAVLVQIPPDSSTDGDKDDDDEAKKRNAKQTCERCGKFVIGNKNLRKHRNLHAREDKMAAKASKKAKVECEKCGGAFEGGEDHQCK